MIPHDLLKTIAAVMFGMSLGIALVIILIVTIPNDSQVMVNRALAQCEKDLPRNEHCYIIAVPPSKD
jgi:hypothetical protein